MRFSALIVVLSVMLASACSGEFPVGEDRSGEVRIKHRIPSK